MRGKCHFLLLKNGSVVFSTCPPLISASSHQGRCLSRLLTARYNSYSQRHKHVLLLLMEGPVSHPALDSHSIWKLTGFQTVVFGKRPLSPAGTTHSRSVTSQHSKSEHQPWGCWTSLTHGLLPMENGHPEKANTGFSCCPSP